MNNKPNQPREFDAVIGGQAPPPVEGVVLGGLEGAKHRLTSTVFEARVAALSDALNYGEAGLDLLIGALQDASEQLQRSASKLLREKGGLKGKQALLDYDPWFVFTTFGNWKIEEFNPKFSITDTVGNAYILRSKNQFKALLKDPQAKQVEALKCQIEDNYYNRKKDFQAFVNALVDAREHLPNLKALFIGEADEYLLGKSKIYISNLRPLLKAYPNLEVLQVRGRLVDDDFLKAHANLEIVQIRSRTDNSVVPIKPLKHNCLKTLIIEATDISYSNLAKICHLDLPSLEYLELWLGKQNAGKETIDSLEPILSNKSTPNLIYLGLISSENTNRLARAVAESLIIERLRVLDLSVGNLSNAGAIALLNCPAVNRLHTLKISENRLPTNIIQWLSELDCRVIAESQFHDRYYSVWE